MPDDQIAVVIVTHRSADKVQPVLEGVSAQLVSGDELVVVDNASPDGTAAAVRAAAPEGLLLEQEANLGFAAGCNIGAAASRAPLLLFLNPDARPEVGCLDALRRVAHERPAWGAWQALVTMEDGKTINTAGNVLHYLGMGWAGRCGQPLSSAPDAPSEVGFASGAALLVRREDWDRLGGFDERYFMYGEDLDLGLRLWLAGRGVGVAPAARVEHDYEFTKGGQKWFLLERNRWWTVLGSYPAPVLALVTPPLLLCELAVILLAMRDGWLHEKLRAQMAVLRDLRSILERRRRIQATRKVSAGEFASRLSADLDSPYLAGVGVLPALPALQHAYWARVQRLLDRP